MDVTSISIGKRVDKSDQNPFGWEKIEQIPNDEVCVLVLGGDATKTDKAANSYAKSVLNLLKENNINNVNVYAASYHLGEEMDDFAVKAAIAQLLFKKHFRTKTEDGEGNSSDILEVLYGKEVVGSENPAVSRPKYIEQLFDKVLLNRISENGKRISVREAEKRVRNLNIITHCHGAQVFLKLEERMQQELKELGYSQEERLAIQKQLLCVSHEPFAPLGVSKSTMISFGSASDNEIFHQNNFHKEIKCLNEQKKLKLSYFPNKQGELFLAPHISSTKESDSEHRFIDYLKPQVQLSQQGQALLKLEGNTIINGVQNSFSGTGLPNTEVLVCGQDENVRKFFNTLVQNGQRIYTEIVSNLKLRKHLKSR